MDRRLRAGYAARLRAAVISDIHSNRQALEAVLAAVEEAGVDQVWCLGDMVGYGADPDACTALVRERCAICLVGNHDLAVLGALDISTFSEAAAAAVEWTRENVSEETLEFLARAGADGLARRASASSTPRRATRSGSTCSPPTRPKPASTPRRSGSA